MLSSCHARDAVRIGCGIDHASQKALSMPRVHTHDGVEASRLGVIAVSSRQSRRRHGARRQPDSADRIGWHPFRDQPRRVGRRRPRHDHGKDPVLSSRHRFGEVMAAAQAAFGIGLASIWKDQNGDAQDVTTDVTLAVHQHHAIHFMRQNGIKLPFVDDPSVFSLTKEFYPTRDGRFVKIETFYPRLRDAAFTVLRCAPTVRAIEAAIMTWDAEDLEERIREYAGAIAVVRTAEEWRNHPVGRRLAEKPVVEVVKIGDSEPIPLPTGGELPLTGLKVLDLTHVVGGPMTARNLAEFGAEVLHLSKFDLPDHMTWRLETDNGKRAAYCDLGVEADKRRFFELLQDADVFTNSFLNLEDKGISPHRLAEARPGIIASELRCFDFEGEWA